MINFFRSFFQSKLGLGLTIGFLILIAIAFAASDVGSSGSFGGLSGTNRVAVVGKEEVTTAELREASNNSLRRLQDEQPTLTLDQFLSAGGLTQALDMLLDRVAISEFGRMLGVRAGDNLLNSEIQTIPAFRGPDGNFSEETYRLALSNQGLTDKLVREDLADGLIARQVLIPAVFGAKLPERIVRRYVSQLKERRTGAVGQIPSAAFVPEGDPTDKQLQAFYKDNREDFVRPERRKVRYVQFGVDALGERAAPTDAEIRKAYQDNAAAYAAREERSFTQLIVPTKQAAESFRQRIAGGESMASIARDAGLDTASIGPVTKQDFSRSASAAVANAVFAAAQGKVATVARSPLGYHVVMVDKVDKRPARSLADARDEIANELRADKQRRAMSEYASEIEDRLNDGESLSEIAKELKLDVQTTRPLLPSGQVFGAAPGETAPQMVMPLVATAFQMEEGKPQIAELTPGQEFVLFEAADIAPSAAPPLKEIRDEVTFAWKMAEGAKEAKKAADRILKRVADGSTLAAAVRAETKRLPPVQSVDMTREEVMQNPGDPAAALLFAMAQGTAKRLAAPNDRGFILIALDKIVPGKVEKDDPLMAQAAAGYGNILSREYGDQLREAIRKDVGVERNPDAIAAVRRELTGKTR